MGSDFGEELVISVKSAGTSVVRLVWSEIWQLCCCCGYGCSVESCAVMNDGGVEELGPRVACRVSVLT